MPIRVAPDVHIAADTRHSARLPRKPASFPHQFYSIRPRFPRQRANDRAPDDAPAATSPEVNPDDPVDADVHAAVVAEVSPTHVPPRSLRETNETRPSPRAFLYPRQRHFSFHRLPLRSRLFSFFPDTFRSSRNRAIARIACRRRSRCCSSTSARSARESPSSTRVSSAAASKRTTRRANTPTPRLSSPRRRRPRTAASAAAKAGGCPFHQGAQGAPGAATGGFIARESGTEFAEFQAKFRATSETAVGGTRRAHHGTDPATS